MANSFDMYYPEVWANESLAILEENMVMAKLVHRDFENELSQMGDTVNTRKPADFVATLKTDDEDITIQDASSTNVAVVLNQHAHVAFVIRDAEKSKSMKSLIEEYMKPAAIAIGRQIDASLCGAVYQFLGYRAGQLQSITSSNAKSFLLNARNKLNVNKAPDDGNRRLILAPGSETAMLNLDLFTDASAVGTPMALSKGWLGQKFNMDIFMAQNVPSPVISSTVDVATGTITNAASAGTTGSQACSVASYDVVVGSWVTVAGNMQPQEVTARTFSTNTTAVTLSPANEYDTSASAVLTAYKTVTVNLAAGYAAGYHKGIILDGFTSGKFLQVGQLLSFGTGASRKNYCVIRVTGASGTAQTVYLDRPLEAALVDDQVGYTGPAGAYNFAFHKNALTLVTRPMDLPSPGLGATGMNAIYNDMAMRVVMQYDINKQGTVVNFDVLYATKVLDAYLGVAMFG